MPKVKIFTTPTCGYCRHTKVFFKEHGVAYTEADVAVDTTGGSPTVDADASVDTSAEGGLVDADTTASADVVDQELTSDTGLEVDMGSDTTLAESSLDSEIGTATAPATTETEAGLEADVEGVGASDAITEDPADGLVTTTTL